MLVERRLQAFNKFRSNILNLLNIRTDKNLLIKTIGTVSVVLWDRFRTGDIVQ